MDVIIKNNTTMTLGEDFSKGYLNALKAKAKAEEEVKKYEAKLLEEMTKNNLEKIEDTRIVATYVTPTIRTTLDSSSLKVELPDLWKKYARETKVKESLRVKTKLEF